jgi:GNAT superfamily N-acetyltransferase
MQQMNDKTGHRPPQSEIRELTAGATVLAFKAMLALREGRPVMASSAQFVEWVDSHARPGGYRLIASLVPDREEAVAVSGFRILHTLAWGKLLYIDDLVTLPEFRGGGHGHLLLEWLSAEAARLGCEQLHLDSGHHRHGAHRFYLNHGLSISCHHFSRILG